MNKEKVIIAIFTVLLLMIVTLSILLHKTQKRVVKENYIIAENERLERAVDSLIQEDNNMVVTEYQTIIRNKVRTEKEIQYIFSADPSQLIQLKQKLRDSIELINFQ